MTARPSGPEAVARRFSMAGRRALVTGGSLGIGRAITIAFTEAGADVAIQHDRAADAAAGQPGAAERVVEDLRHRSRRAAVVAADFGRAGEARRAFKEAVEALGGVDVVVACASIQVRAPFEEVTPEQIDRQVRINLAATVELLQAALPAMKARGWGRALTVGSVNQTRPEPELAVYAALKSAQANLSLNLARAYAPFGVTVNNLSPGLVATERNRWRREDAAAWEEIQRRANPMGRAATPEEIAGAALLLCSEAGGFITGADVQVTGGGHL